MVRGHFSRDFSRDFSEHLLTKPALGHNLKPVVPFSNDIGAELAADGRRSHARVLGVRSVSGMAVAHPLLEGRSRRETLLFEGFSRFLAALAESSKIHIRIEAQRLEAPVPVGIDDALAAKVEPLFAGLGGIVYAEPGIHAWLAQADIEIADGKAESLREGEGDVE